MKKIGKVIGAGIVAFCILNVFCLVFYRVPIHNECKSKATEYKWGENRFYSRATEGFAYGMTDENGYNNICVRKEQPLGLIMGSSQMEAFQVFQDKNTCAVTNKNLSNKNINGYLYNIGISSHTLLNCANNLEDAIDVFDPRKYVIIETQNIKFSNQKIEETIDGAMLHPLRYKNKGIKDVLQRVDYLRLIYRQWKNYNTKRINNGDAFIKKLKNGNSSKKTNSINKLMKFIALKGKEKNKKIIIFYHPHLKLLENGNAKPLTNEENLNCFAKACSDNGIVFLDMTNKFMNEYKEKHILPHGFYNTSQGKGHLNENGHRMIAEELSKLILKMEDK